MREEDHEHDCSKQNDEPDSHDGEGAHLHRCRQGNKFSRSRRHRRHVEEIPRKVLQIRSGGTASCKCCMRTTSIPQCRRSHNPCDGYIASSSKSHANHVLIVFVCSDFNEFCVDNHANDRPNNTYNIFFIKVREVSVCLYIFHTFIMSYTHLCVHPDCIALSYISMSK